MQRVHYVLGIDIGSVAVGLAVVDGSKNIVQTGYAFHHGELEKTMRRLLEGFDLSRVERVAATASTPALVNVRRRFNNEIATIAAARRHHLRLESLLVVGGEKFSLAMFDERGQYQGSRSNTSCAAGTGSFLDQQAGRLNLDSTSELCDVACECRGKAPKIASRCAVFAKTDLIHAQQEGYGLEEISDGLCHGLAKNIVDTLFTVDRRPAGEVLFCGGVSKNRAVARHISELTGLELTVPELGHLYGAVGASYLLLDEEEEDEEQTSPFSGIEALLSAPAASTKKYYYPPLRLEYSDYPDFSSCEQYTDGDGSAAGVEVDIYRPLESGSTIEVFVGIDIGSTSTKAVLLDRELEVVAGFYTRTAGRPLVAVQNIFASVAGIQARKRLEFVVVRCGTTGSGRKFIGKIVGADAMIDEITAHARAACQLNPEVDTIIEIGGQDAKFTTLQNGRVTSSTMNTVCAAGTGSFIEEQASKLGCAVTDYSARAENVRAPMVSDRCTVFMERDMNHYLSEGYSTNEVLAAALHAVRENYLIKVATEKHIGTTVFFQGATARNKALVAAFEQRLGRPILVSKFCHLTGALGTSLILAEEEREATSTFRGFALYRRPIPISGEVCGLCANHCKISVAEVDGKKVAYGFLCGRDYEGTSYVKADSGAFDLLRERRKLERFEAVEPGRGGPVVGLPAAVHLVEDLPLWKKFFALLGVETVSSEGYKGALAAGKQLTGAEFCAPMTAMHGHAAWLLERADHVFLPIYLEDKAREGRRHYCYYTQFLPALASGVGEDERFLRPVIKYLYTSFHTRMQLYRMMQRLGGGRWSFLEVSQAYERALQFQQQCRQRLKRVFEEKIADGSDVKVVFLGRPYTVLSPAMNGNIPDIFRKLGIDAFYQDMLDYDRQEVAALQPLLDELHWEHAVRILEATEVTARRDDLYPVFLTSFKCSPDSFTLEYFKAVMDRHGKPYLILQLDEHDSSVGYETRIEAAIRSFRNHRLQSRRLELDYAQINPRLATTMKNKRVIFPNWDHITCSLLAATLQREGYDVVLMEETEQTIRESLKHNSGQCIPLNAIAQGYMQMITSRGFEPADCVLWLNDSELACNIKLYPHHIKQILTEHGMGEAGVYVGELSFAEISLRAAKNAYFAFMLGGMLRKIACKIRPYEVVPGETDRVLAKSVALLADSFRGIRRKEEALREIISHFQWIETKVTPRPKVAIFGDIYVRDNRVMNQDLIRFIEAHGGEAITTPYSEYAKMVARSYFRKWFNEGKYLDVLTHRALLVTMSRLERRYIRLINRILCEPEHDYDDDPAEILAGYNVSIENTGESTDNILKIHYIKKHCPEVSLFVQTSPALCCASLITEAMRHTIERKTGVPVVSLTYDGTGG